MSNDNFNKKNIAEKCFREDLKGYQPYKPKEYEYEIKMNANESPWDMPAKVALQLADELKNGMSLRYYPDSDATILREALGKVYGKQTNQIMVGNGSDELIGYIMNAFIGPGDGVITAVPTFEMYSIYAGLTGGVVHTIPYNSDFSLDVDAMLQRAVETKSKVSVFCTPGNPGGYLIPKDQILKFASSFDGMVVVDEAYMEFAGAEHSLIPYCDTLSNIIVLRTFSKAYAMAGLRVGYLIANSDTVEILNKVKIPFNVNSFSQRAALLMLENQKEVSQRVQLIIQERERVFNELNSISGVTTFVSSANFLLFQVPDSEFVFQTLLENGILIRKYTSAALNNCLRVSIGTSCENDRFLSVLKAL